jgi:N6-adenosine-specific RNA methylase IME4
MLMGIPEGMRAGAILIDPAYWWKARSEKGEGRSARRHYKDGKAMTLEEIKAYPVVDYAAADCFLFSWIPSTFLPVAFEIMDAWGFPFSSTAFCWVKLTRERKRGYAGSTEGFPLQDLAEYRALVRTGKGFHMGNGYTTRKNIELCLLGRRGNPKRLSASVRELIIAPVREHSRKPDEQYERIEKFCAGPYLELFARQRWPGWTSIGDQLDHFKVAS